MAKPATATWGADTSRVQVAYVKSRHVLQLTGPADTTSTLEVPLFEFCHNLGIDARDIGPPIHYLLFAQLHTDPSGTTRHVVETFATDDEARETFRALRLRRSHPDDWAEMVSLDAAGRLQPQCWFGTPWGPGGRNRTVPPSAGGALLTGTRKRLWIRPRRRLSRGYSGDLPASTSSASSPKRKVPEPDQYPPEPERSATWLNARPPGTSATRIRIRHRKRRLQSGRF